MSNLQSQDYIRISASTLTPPTVRNHEQEVAKLIDTGRRASPRRRSFCRCRGRALCGGRAAGVLYPVGGRSARGLFAAAAATPAMPLLRFDAGIRRGDRIRPVAGNALSPLLALRDRVESCASDVHHLRRDSFAIFEGNRRRFRGDQS